MENIRIRDKHPGSATLIEPFKEHIFFTEHLYIEMSILGIETAAEVAVDRRSGRVHEYRRRKQGPSLCVQLACTRTLLELLKDRDISFKLFNLSETALETGMVAKQTLSTSFLQL